MKKALLLVLILCVAALMLAGTQTRAQNQVRASTQSAACDDHRLPASLRTRIVLESRGEAVDGVLSDTRLASDDEGRALLDWYGASAQCRAARAARVSALSPAAGDLRRTLDARNGQTLADLAGAKISYGAANRQWAEGEGDFNRLYANVLAIRAPLSAPNLPTSNPASDPAIAAANRAYQQQLDMNAQAQRLYDDAMKARTDAARPALCPTNPAGLPGPAPDPVAQPFC